LAYGRVPGQWSKFGNCLDQHSGPFDLGGGEKALVEGILGEGTEVTGFPAS